MLDELSANTSLTSAAGATSKVVPTGSPFVVVSSGSIAPKASASVTLEFAVPSSGGITYDARTLSGGLQP